jgi:hypothetical protein
MERPMVLGCNRDMLRYEPLIAVAALATALAAMGCGRAVVLPSPIEADIERAGLHLEAASVLDPPPVTPGHARLAAREAFEANEDLGQITRVTLVTVSGPGNPRLGWDPRAHRLAYAVEWTEGSTVGLMLVSAVTGEVLYNTAY